MRVRWLSIRPKKAGIKGLACALAAWGTLSLGQPAAHATTFMERPFPESVKDAPVIVRGTVGNTYTDWGHGRDSAKRIYTYWELQVAEVFKGAAEGHGLLRIREMGGEKDGVGMQIAGTANFNAGEDVVVFLSEKNGEGSYDIWGTLMGKYVVKKDADGQETLSGAGIGINKPRITDGDDRGQPDPQGASKWTLEALRRLVASQGDAPAPVSSNPSETPASPAPIAAHSTPAASPSAAAPQLQPSTPEESTFPTGWAFAVGALILGGAGLVFARKTRQR